MTRPALGAAVGGAVRAALAPGTAAGTFATYTVDRNVLCAREPEDVVPHTAMLGTRNAEHSFPEPKIAEVTIR